MGNNLDSEEQRLAKQLELAHEKLIRESNVSASNLDDALAPAANMLELINKIKRHDAPSPDETEAATKTETPNDVGRNPISELDAVLQADATKIARFELKERLGQGGFGMVYRAFDPELGRDVAIKMPRLEKVFTSDLKTRFIREAKAIAALSHPGIVTIYEADSYGSIFFLVTEYVPGQSLGDWLHENQSPLEAKTAAGLAASLADAVQHAHSRGVLHRDIKPANVLLDESGESISHNNLASIAKLTDFGLAKFAAETEQYTQSGTIVGSPMYMAPEQIRSAKDGIDFRSDVYSLGAVLYELLTGQPPFSGETVIDVISAVQEKEPTPPRSIHPRIPSDLESVCLKCLEKNPNSRYATARELGDDLHRFLDGIPVNARKVTNVDRVFRWANRNRGLSTALAALAFVLVVGSFVTTILTIKNDFLERQADSRAELAESRRLLAERRFSELESAIDEIYEAVKRMPEIKNAQFGAVRQELLASVNRYYANLESEAPSDSPLKNKKINSLLKLIQLKSSLADDTGAEEIAQNILDELEANTDEFSAEQKIDTMVLAAKLFFDQRNNKEGQYCFDRVFELAKQEYAGQDSPNDHDRIELSQTISELAEIAGDNGLRGLSNELALEAIEIWEEIETDSISNDDATLSMALAYLGASKTHAASEKTEQAKLFNGFAIQLLEQTLSPVTRGLPNSQYYISECYRIRAALFLDNRDLCLGHLKKANATISGLTNRHPAMVKYHIQVISTNYFRGLVEFVNSKNDANPKPALLRASEEFQKNIDYADRLAAKFPDEAQRIVMAAKNSVTMLGISAGELGDHEKQLAALKQALQINETLYESTGRQDDLVLTIGNRSNIANYYLNRKNYSEAIARYESTISDLQQVLAEDPQAGQVSRFLSADNFYLAQAYSAVGRHEDALAAQREAIKLDQPQQSARGKGHEAIYLAKLNRIAEAHLAYNDACRFLNANNNVRELVLRGTNLLKTLESQDAERGEDINATESNALRNVVLQSCLDALADLRDTNESDFQTLVQNSSLDALTQSDEFKSRFPN